MKHSQILKKLEDLELDEMSPSEMDALARSIGKQVAKAKGERSRVRYQLYRLRTESLGGPSADTEPDLKEKIEAHPHFGGWRFFAETWDVAIDDPYRCVHREKSESEEWDDIIREKFPIVEPGGTLTYPDKSVERRVKAEVKRVKKGRK